MSTYTKRYLLSATAINTKEKTILVIIEHRAAVLELGYSIMFPTDGP